MSDSRPIGVFDSGIGGLTVVRELLRLMPNEKIIYLGDTARCPYGGRSEETIKNFGIQDARFLMSMDIKMIVVACNTVSSVALENIQEYVNNIPVIGVVLPGSKAAVIRTAVKRIGVIGTAATIRTGAYSKTIRNLDNKIKVYSKSCPLFVPLVEEGMLETDITKMVVQHYLYELVDTGMDCLILGCTHYPLLMEIIQGTVGTNIQLIDSAFWTAKEAQDMLQVLDALSADKFEGKNISKFYVTDRVPDFENNASRFFDSELEDVEKVDLEVLVN